MLQRGCALGAPQVDASTNKFYVQKHPNSAHATRQIFLEASTGALGFFWKPQERAEPFFWELQERARGLQSPLTWTRRSYRRILGTEGVRRQRLELAAFPQM
jgi:hypothetical protein